MEQEQQTDMDNAPDVEILWWQKRGLQLTQADASYLLDLVLLIVLGPEQNQRTAFTGMYKCECSEWVTPRTMSLDGHSGHKLFPKGMDDANFAHCANKVLEFLEKAPVELTEQSREIKKLKEQIGKKVS